MRILDHAPSPPLAVDDRPATERDIEAALEARTSRACVFMHSGRFAIHIAFRLLLSPGDRILMSPLEDDTVFFGALAAGLRPVMAPVSASDGNVRFEAVDDATWSGIAAVLTGNTYGLPDRVVELRSRCDQLNIPLIEDAAHALETEVDQRPVGSFGAASIFSLSKHFPGRGGVLSLEDEDRRHDAIRLRDELTAPTARGRRAVRIARSAAGSALEALQLRGAVDRARDLMHPVRPVPWRIPLRAPQLERALSATDLGMFDEWIETAYPDYRMQQPPSALNRTLAGLRALERDREERIRGVLCLRELASVAPAAREGAPLPLLRVPLLIEDRDAVALELRRRRINVYFVYAPPLDDYSGPEFSEPSPDPEAARWWATHVLPVHPHDAERVLDLVERDQIRLEPAIPLDPVQNPS
jgi:dTDP-4-amino-4,6-dideoxygalactose transaminase